ncbi:MAG: IS30 family transposase [Nitrospira sp.]|nr:IS30 family transposase [Nitrospira sp.]
MPYQHLTLEERSMMAPMRMLGWSIRSIAAQLGRAPSTISRELRRNCDGSGAYAGYWAHCDAQRRRRNIRRSHLTSGMLATYVQEKLQCRWSPEQIAHRVRVDYPHATQMRISHQTIYPWLAADHRTGGSWSRHLRHHCRRRKRYGSGTRVSRRATGHCTTPRTPGRLGRGSRGRSRPARLRGYARGPAQSLSSGGQGVTPDCYRGHGGHAETSAPASSACTADPHRG